MSCIQTSSIGKLKGFAGLLFLFVIFLIAIPSTNAATTEPYNWKDVPTGGGGFVTGLVIHPTEPDLLYIRTDVGGVLRWDPINHKWIQLLNILTEADKDLYGVDSIALDPSNPDVVYIAAGSPYSYAKSEILKSTDRGATWEKTGFLPRSNGNGPGRGLGERLAVDPNAGNIIFMGTRYDGLWKSTAAAGNGTWQKVATFPTIGRDPIGLNFVVFDKSTGTPGNATQTVYVGVKGSGVYRSMDGGATWSLMSGSPLEPNRAALASDGTLYVGHGDETLTGNGMGVAKFAGGVWTDTTPTVKVAPYNSITVHPTNPNIVMAAIKNEEIYRSTDGGTTWEKMNRANTVAHPNIPWWTNNFWGSNIASLTIDPFHPNQVWFTDFFGTWRAEDITASPSHWYTFEEGHEELVTFALRSTPIGAPLLRGVADLNGFRHASLTAYPSSRFSIPDLGGTTSIDFQESNPNFVARVGGTLWYGTGGGGYSTNNGETWTAFPSPLVRYGKVAVSAASETMVWVPEKSVPQYSTDRGQTWKASIGAPSTAVHDYWTWYQPLASDRVNNDTFYLMDRMTGTLYRSTDGGANWLIATTFFSQFTGTDSNGNPTPLTPYFNVKTAPTMAGEVWVSLESGGLYRSSNAGDSFTKLANVQRAKHFAFGKGRLGYSNPTVFVYGTVDNTVGIFRSDDLGVTWVKINIPNPAIGNEVTVMEGDRQVWGRVYIGNGGSGVFYGETLASEGTDFEPPTQPTNLAAIWQTATTIKLSWRASTDNTGVVGYNVYSGPTLVGSTLSPSDTSFIVTGLTPNTTYSFTVQAKDAAGNVSAVSNSLSTTTAPPPSPPTNLTLTQTSMTSVSLSWSPPANLADVSGYNVYSGTKLIGTTPSTTFTVSDLLPGKKFTFTVRSKDMANSTSAPSNALVATTTLGPGTLIFSDNFEDGNADGWTSLNGSWAIATNNTKVYRQSIWTSVNAFGTVDASNWNDGTWSNYSIEASSKVTYTNNSATTTNGVVARYTNKDNHYTFRYMGGKLQIGKYVNGTYSTLVQKNYSMVLGVSYTFTAILNNNNLDFYVDGIKELTAKDSSHKTGKIGVFTWQTAANFDLVEVISNNDFVPPTVVGDLSSPSKSETTVDLVWSPSTDNQGVTQYEVYNGQTLVGTVTSATYSYTVTGLAANTAYTFSIKAKDAAGNVSGANPLQVTTAPYLVKPKNTLAPITIDGSLNEAVWHIANPVNKTIIGTPNHTAEYGVLWDSTYLYIGVKVTDSELNNDSIYVHNDDSVEIYID